MSEALLTVFLRCWEREMLRAPKMSRLRRYQRIARLLSQELKQESSLEQKVPAYRGRVGGYLAKIRRGRIQSGRRELRMVEEINSVSPELKLETLQQVESALNISVPFVEAVRSQTPDSRRERPHVISVWGFRRVGLETSRVEPVVQRPARTRV